MAHVGEFKTIIKELLRPLSKYFATNLVACGEACGRWQFGNKLFDEGKVTIFKTVINTKANAFNPMLREKTRKELNLTNKIVIGHIGRFVPQKNPLFMLDVFSEICKIENKAVLLLIGDGKLKSDILKKIEQLGIKDKVLYLGRREDIYQFYNVMDAFLLPSLYEGLPVVGLEAQSCGLPTFFSSEVTVEARACELGYFINLCTPISSWANDILSAIYKNMPIRQNRASDVAAAGFDSIVESQRLKQYYIEMFDMNCRRDGMKK